MKAAVSVVLSVAVFLTIISCSDEASTQWSGSLASGLAISSITATSASRQSDGESFDESDVRASEITSTQTIAEKAAVISSIAGGTAAGGCNVTLPTLNGMSGRAECYGPTVTYTNHPDGSPTSGSLPTGDLGIWLASEGTEPCAVAQINKLMATTSSYVDAALLLQASSICLLNANGTAAPTVGAEVDFTSTFATSLATKNEKATVTSAKATLVSEGLWQFTFVGTTDGVKAFEVTMRIKNTSTTAYQGRIYGYFTTTDKDAFSVIFKRDGSTLQARMLAGTYRGSSATTAIFSNGDLILDDTWHGNMNQALMNVNLDTQIGNISYAWQAGSGDDKTRVFNAYTKATTRGAAEGCGYFGYGTDFQATLSSNTNTISGFICNWAGPGNDHSMSTTGGKAQKQCFSRGATGGFTEVTAKQAITYAPNVACNDTTAFTYTPSPSGDNSTNNLITLASDTEYTTNYTTPTAPTLDTGI